MNAIAPIRDAGAPPPALDGEILPPERVSTVQLQPHPFSQARMRFDVPEGATIYGVVLASGLRPTIFKHVRVWIGDEEIPLGVWHLVRPKAGTHVFIKLTPQGIGGGSNMIRTLLMLAVVVAATAVAGPLGTALATAGLGTVLGGVAASVIVTGASMLGMYLINMLIPPPKEKVSERNFLQALRNRFNPFGAVPRVLGKRRVWPVLAAHPYTESQNGKRYLRAMLLVGFGPMRISDIRIGETSIGVYDNIDVEIREGWYDETYGKFRLTTALRHDFDSTVQGWAGSGATLAVVNGALRITPSTSSPQVSQGGLSINGQQNYVVRAKIRRTAGTSWIGRVYFSTAGHGYSASFYESIANPFTSNDEWIICEWDMSSLTVGGSDWRNSTITGLRFDLAADSSTVFEVEWLEVGYPCGRDPARQIYSRSISQQDIGTKVVYREEQIRTTDPDSIGFGVDVDFPGGLGEQDKDNPGDIDKEEVHIEVRYRLLGTTTWKVPKWSSNVPDDGTGVDGELSYKAKTTTEAMIGGWALFPSKGQYEIRLYRTTAEKTGRKFGDTYWSLLRSIKDSSPIADDLVGGLTLISVRAKATDQFQSFPDQINCIAESYLPVVNNAGGFTYDITRNPAWAFTDLLRHRGKERTIADSRINMAAIRQWAAGCDALAPNSTEPYWRVDAQLEGGSIFENCREIASHARASFIVENGLYSVVRDIPQTVPVQLITPKNSWGYTGSKQFIDMPHALRVKFTNADKNWREDERIVYDDGYNKDNATRFESLDFIYCTDADQVYREARYHMAVGKLRPEQHHVTMDIEALRCTLGDYVLLSHDVLSIGSGTGRVRALTGTSTITAITLDESIALQAGKSYGIRYRRGTDGVIYTAQLAAIGVTADYTTLNLSVGIPSSTAPLVGDLVIVGEFGVEVAPMLVKRVEPGPDMTATLTLVDAQPGVWTADSAVIPPHNSYITQAVDVPQQRPAVPTFRLVSDESALVRLADGSMPDQIMVIITAPAGSLLAVGSYDIQFRETPPIDGQGSWGTTIQTPVGKNTVYLNPVRAGLAYDVRVRSVSDYGLTSDWVTIFGHTVIGKTTPPGQVLDVVAVAGIEGVQISWTPNTEPDLKGYIVKRGLDWNSAVLVSDNLSATTIFVACDTSVQQTFIIRAIDLIGLTSTTDAQATSSSVTPPPVTGLEGYLQVDVAFLRWNPVDLVGVRYEVRQGADWKTATLIGTVSNSEAKARLPTTTVVDRTYWVDSVSSLGVYSGQPKSVTLTVLPVPNQNVVASRDLSALGFPGVLHDVSSGGSSLSLDLDGSGTQRPQGDYFYALDLGATLPVRSWADFLVTSVAGSGLTWDSASFSWDGAGERTWLGSVSQNRAGDVVPRLSIDSGFDATLIEGWRWNSSPNGNKGGTAPTVSSGLSYANARVDVGAQFDRKTKLSYALAVPSTFAVALDIRVRASQDSFLAFKLLGSGIALWCCYNAEKGLLAVFDHLGRVTKVSIPAEASDVWTVLVNQTATTRTLYVRSRRHPNVVSDAQDFAPIGAFTSVAFHE